MKTRNLNLLAVALCGALAAPIASAQLVDRPIRTNARAAVSAQLPARAADRAVDQARGQVDRLRDEVERQDAQVDVDAQASAAAHSKAGMEDAWLRLDVDGDGRISLDEAGGDEVLADAFGSVDADGDGFVSDVEYRAHAQAGHVVDASATGAEHAAAHSAVAVRATWAELDADGDGLISALEADVDADFATGFEDLDADGDGFVSEAEFRAEAKADLDPPG